MRPLITSLTIALATALTQISFPYLLLMSLTALQGGVLNSLPRFTAAAERLARAERVFCLGMRSTFAVVYVFHYVRSLFGDTSVLVDGPGGTGIDAIRTIRQASAARCRPAWC